MSLRAERSNLAALGIAFPRNAGILAMTIRFPRSDWVQLLPELIGNSQSGQAMYLRLRNQEEGSGPGGADQQ